MFTTPPLQLILLTRTLWPHHQVAEQKPNDARQDTRAQPQVNRPRYPRCELQIKEVEEIQDQRYEKGKESQFVEACRRWLQPPQQHIGHNAGCQRHGNQTVLISEKTQEYRIDRKH